ncbi:MAG: hypothetical protein AAB468_00410 [Patescibacteria group bacterium]
MNRWEISLSREALKFLRRNHFPQAKIIEPVVLAIKKLSGENTNIDIKKLNPPYEDHFRIRVGRTRIICCPDFVSRSVSVREINWRGSSYK